MHTADISIFHLFIGLLLVFIPGAILYYYRTGITRSMFIAVARMVVQLFLVGIYLKYLFEWNNVWVNTAWFLVMIGVCVADLLKRIRISFRVLFMPMFLAVFVSLSLIVVYFLKVVVGLDYLFDGRYFIPVCGILLGNVLSSNVVGLNAFYDRITREQQYYNYLLCNGATVAEATRPFIREALIKAYNPTIAGIAVMGLISLPGTLSGQIMGGSAPDIAIRYQIMIMVIIMSSTIISLLLGLQWSIRRMLDGYGRFRTEVMDKK